MILLFFVQDRSRVGERGEGTEGKGDDGEGEGKGEGKGKGKGKTEGDLSGTAVTVDARLWRSITSLYNFLMHFPLLPVTGPGPLLRGRVSEQCAGAGVSDRGAAGPDDAIENIVV